MRFRFVAPSLVLLCVLAGCDSLPTRVRERFEPAQPQTRVYEAESRAVFEAAQAALKRLDFRIVRAGAAQGSIAAISRIQPGSSFGTGRQYAFDVKLTSVEPKRTEVAVVLREQEESTSFAGATDIPLRQHGLYDSFFDGLAQALKDKQAGAR